MLKSLSDVDWKEFSLKTIFTNYHGKRLTKDKRKVGLTPLLTASELNQGVSDYICNKDMQRYKDFISIDMFGHAFCHNYEACGDDNIYIFINNKISFHAKLFIITCINQNSLKYSYGNQFRQDNADNDKIMLPVTLKGEPDYEFMEKYIKEREEKLKKQYEKYVQKTLEKLHKKISLKKDWKAFEISDIFTIKSGKRLTTTEMTIGNTPFIGATDNRNGITNYVNNINSSMDKNVLGVNYDGNGVAISFYHPYSCLFTDSVKRFHLKNYNDDKYVLLFMKSVILKQKNKYMYGYKFCESGMLRQKIMLPVDSNSKPDYKYMKDYMRYLEQKKMLKCLEYIFNWHSENKLGIT